MAVLLRGWHTAMAPPDMARGVLESTHILSGLLKVTRVWKQ